MYAIQHLNEILTIWPMVEGDVSTRDSKLYSDIETKIPHSDQSIRFETG